MTSRTIDSSYILTIVSLLFISVGCPTRRDDDGNSQVPVSAASATPTITPDTTTTPQASGDDHSAHHVVFADRTSHAYLLLLPHGVPTPTRDSLTALVRSTLSKATEEPEAQLLLELISTEPRPLMGDPRLNPQQRESIRHADLLGLHLDTTPIVSDGEQPLVSAAVLHDPVSTRELSDAERASLAARRDVLILQAHYRNRYGVRGLRLLQTLVRIAAVEYNALIHDPDTGETFGPDAFTQRRLQSTVGNIADQIIVVPFPDPRHGQDSIRLSTRGMRRFGSVDLELDGLPRDAAILNAATHLLYGLAYRMVRMGEYDQQGYAVEVDEVVELTYDDVARAYAGRESRVPRCQSCPERVMLHLVERPSESHDPDDHVVARLVAPRARSDAATYDHSKWVRSILSDLLGVE